MKFLKNLTVIFSNLLDDILFIVGFILLSIGVFKIFIPAGYIVLGICMIAFAFFIAKSAGGK